MYILYRNQWSFWYGQFCAIRTA